MNFYHKPLLWIVFISHYKTINAQKHRKYCLYITECPLGAANEQTLHMKC